MSHSLAIRFVHVFLDDNSESVRTEVQMYTIISKVLIPKRKR